ncbi:testis-expressed protein 51 [Pogona vitticeps]
MVWTGSNAFVVVSMAKAPLLGFLAWVLPTQLAGTCLRCWRDAAVYFGYDVDLLLGQDSEATDKLGKLFLGRAGDRVSNSRQFLEREHMEREAGNLFLRLEKIIQNSGKDQERLLKEAEQEKLNFVKKLEEASHAFLKEICSFSCAKSRFRPYEVVQCINCRLLKAPCNDPVVCAGPNVLTGVSVTFLILLGIGGIWWYRRRKKKAGKEDKSEDDEEKESSSSSEGSESSESEEAVSSPSPARKPSTPLTNNPPTVNIPSPPPFDFPSPPPFSDAGY